MLLGVSGSDVFHMETPLRNNWSSFCEDVNFTHWAKRLSMTMGLPLLLLIFIESSLGSGFGSITSVMAEQFSGACVGVAVSVGVEVAAFVGV